MLRHRSVCFATLIGAALFLQGADVLAGIIKVFTNKADFEAAIWNAGTDTFNDLALNSEFDSPLTGRTAGSHSYRASVSGDSFSMAGTADDRWLSTNTWQRAIVFDNFATGIKAIGGYFFPSNNNGEYLLGSMTLALQDVDNATETITFEASSALAFRGFISTIDLFSLTVTPPSGSFSTANNLILGETPAIPEPGSLVIMSLLGLSLGAGALARKRRKQTCLVGKGA